MTATAAAPNRPGEKSPGRFRLSLVRRRSVELWAFLLPAIAFFVVFFVYPLGYGIYLSLHDVNASTFITGKAPFVGFDNFFSIFSSPLLGVALGNTVTITIVAVSAELIIGLALALLFNRKFPGSRWLPLLILIPWLLPSVVVATVWKWLLAGDGPINDVFACFGLPTAPWLAEPGTALWFVIAVAIWASLPYWSTILSAALKQVPEEQLEAAQLDGAGAWRRLTDIIIPAIWPVISVLIVMSVVYSMLIVDLVLVMTQGGPANATVTLGLLSYRLAFQEFDFGVGGTYGMLLLVLSLGFALIYVWLSRRKERTEQ